MTDHTKAHATEGHHDEHAHHVCSWQAFAKVFATLLVLTVITVAVSRVDFGSLNMFVAMAIAAVKASLVVAVFMHVKWDTAINQIAFLSSLIFLALLFVFTLADFATRGDADPLFLRRAPVDSHHPGFHLDSVEGWTPPQ